MLERYTRPEMGKIWSLENKYNAWLKVEIAATTAKIGVGEVLVADYAAKTAVRVGALADAAAVTALGDLVIFVGRDLTNNPATVQDFDRLTMAATGVGVAITRGDGRGTLYKKHLMFSDVAFYDLPDDVQAALVAKFTTENRFKVLDQV